MTLTQSTCETLSLCMGTCYRQFSSSFFMKSSLVYQKWFGLVALVVFEKHFHFGSGTTMLNSYSMKVSIPLSRDDSQNKILMLNDVFMKDS